MMSPGVGWPLLTDGELLKRLNEEHSIRRLGLTGDDPHLLLRVPRPPPASAREDRLREHPWCQYYAQ
jgi:hypothetical protein